MPIISHFYGILIYMYKEIGGHHNKQHIHAKYNEYEISIDFDGNILGGEIPNRQRKLIEAWIEIHKDELNAAWNCYNEDGQIIKKKGLV